MLDLIQTPFSPAFKEFADDIVTDCFICSPYITAEPIKMLVKTIAAKTPKSGIKITVLTDLSYRTLVHGATETSALLYLFEHHHDVCVTYLPKVHAKVYIANQTKAIITSANFTQGGGKLNFEYGVKINDSATVQKIQSDMNKYRNLGTEITQSELEKIHIQVEEVKGIIQAEQKNIAKIIDSHSLEKRRNIEDDLIRTRVKNRSINAIFSETLLYLLSKHPAKTRELNIFVSGIHPDLCDGSEDRVIDGKHYGKLWKHQVRNSQQHLLRAGSIYYDQKTQLWHKVNQ